MEREAPINFLPVEGVELSNEKVMRLAWELADALNDYADQSFHAVVYPSDKRGDWSVGFMMTDRCTSAPTFCREDV